MDDSSQLLNSLTSGSGDSASQALNGIQAQIAQFFWLGTILSVVLTIAFVAYLVYKMRVQSAILRIDKNLQKLVDFQVPAVEKVVVEKPKKSEPETVEESDEQK